jgi:hypothetical protein
VLTFEIPTVTQGTVHLDGLLFGDFGNFIVHKTLYVLKDFVIVLSEDRCTGH